MATFRWHVLSLSMLMSMLTLSVLITGQRTLGSERDASRPASRRDSWQTGPLLRRHLSTDTGPRIDSDSSPDNKFNPDAKREWKALQKAKNLKRPRRYGDRASMKWAYKAREFKSAAMRARLTSIATKTQQSTQQSPALDTVQTDLEEESTSDLNNAQPQLEPESTTELKLEQSEDEETEQAEETPVPVPEQSQQPKIVLKVVVAVFLAFLTIMLSPKYVEARLIASVTLMVALPALQYTNKERVQVSSVFYLTTMHQIVMMSYVMVALTIAEAMIIYFLVRDPMEDRFAQRFAPKGCLDWFQFARTHPYKANRVALYLDRVALVALPLTYFLSIAIILN